MVAQNLTKKPSKSDDEISVESFSEATQEKRLEEVKASVASSAAASGSNLTTNTTSVTSPPSASTEKRKVKYKERKIITPSMPIAPAASIVAAQQKQKQIKNNGNSNR